MLTSDGKAIIYREKRIHPALRMFAVFLGLGLATVIPAPFVMHAQWGTPSPILLLAAFCIVFPIAVGALFVLIGLASSTELRLDPATRRAERRLRGPIVNRHESFRFSEMPAPEVVMCHNSEDGPFPILRLPLPRGRRLDMACFANRAEAEAWRDRIARPLVT